MAADTTSVIIRVSTQEDLVECLRKQTNFTVIPSFRSIDLYSLHSVKPNTSQLQLFVDGLKENSTLEELKLDGGKVGREGLQSLCEWLKTNHSLRYLWLWEIQGVDLIIESLRVNSFLLLQELKLPTCHITDEEIVGLSEWLKTNTSLKKLDLSYNKISNQGFVCLMGAALKNNITLQSLDLSCNDMKDERVSTIVQETCCCLREMEIRNFSDTTKNIIKRWLSFDELHRATATGNLEIMKRLLKTELGRSQLNKVSKVEEESGTPLHLAIVRNDLEGVQLLLSHKANTDVRANGKRPIDIAKSPRIREAFLFEALETIKIVVVGHGRVGKTTTLKSIKALQQKSGQEGGGGKGGKGRGTSSAGGEQVRIQHNESTVGLATSNIFIPSENTTEKDLKTRVWDFAGQLEYLPCHRHLLSSQRTVFVVVIDSSLPVDRQLIDLHFWLDFLSKSVLSRDPQGRFSKERLLIVVGTKLDLRTDKDTAPTQLELRYAEMAKRIGMEKVFNKEWIRTIMISNIQPRTILNLQQELFKMVNVVKKNGHIDEFILRRATSLFFVLRKKSTDTVVSRQSELSKDKEALEYLHNSGEVAFLEEVGWVCLDPTILERCLALFIGPERHQHLLSVEIRKEAVICRSQVLGRIEGFLNPKVVAKGGAEGILQMLTEMGVCFESQEEDEVNIVFPSEFEEGESLILPPSAAQQRQCHRITLKHRSREEELGMEIFQKVVKRLWPNRHKEYRVFVDGLLVIPSSKSQEPANQKERWLSVVQSKSGVILITSWLEEAGDEIKEVIINSLEMTEVIVEKDKIPLYSLIGGGEIEAILDSLPVNLVLSSTELAVLLSSSSSQVVPEPLPLPLSEFVGVILQDNAGNPTLQSEFDMVKKRLFEYLSRGHLDFDFELDKAVMIVNKRVEKRFMDRMHLLLRERQEDRTSSDSTRGLFEKETEDERRGRQRVLKKMEECVARVPGSEKTNLVMAWHAHERKNLYLNVINGQFIPAQVDPTSIQELKEGKVREDFGFFGRGAYFSQTPQYVLDYIRGEGAIFVLQLSWILPGRVYPVIEPIVGPNTLHGQPKVEGFDSHYVLTDRLKSSPLNEQPKGDELVVFDSDQVYPRYLLFLKKAKAFYSISDRIEGVGSAPLLAGPVLLWVDDKTPDVLPSILRNQQKFSEAVRVQVHHFTSTGEALSWIGKNRESLLSKVARDHLRIASNSYRKDEAEVMGGRRLYQLIREDPHLLCVPFMIYCGDKKLAGFTEEEQKADEFLKVTDNSTEALEFGGEAVEWLKDHPEFEWKVEKGPGVFVRLVGMTGLPLTDKEMYYAVVSKSMSTGEVYSKRNSDLLSYKTEMTLGGQWNWLSPRLSQDIQVTVFRQRVFFLSDEVMGFRVISKSDLEAMTPQVTRRFDLNLTYGAGGIGTVGVRARVMKLDTERDMCFKRF